MMRVGYALGVLLVLESIVSSKKYHELGGNHG